MKKRMTLGGSAGGPLLGKSRPERTLVGHTNDVMEAFESLFGSPDQPTELTNQWLRFFRLKDGGKFLTNGRAAAACHDWGKANDGFQGMLRHQGKQLLRHEQVSVLLMSHATIWKWLEGNKDLDCPLILSAVAGHHLKARDVEFGQPQTEIDSLMRLRWDDSDLRTHLAVIARKLKLDPSVPDNIPKVWSFEGNGPIADLGRAMDEVRARLEGFRGELDKAEDDQRLRLLWAVRAGLIAADSAGSGLFRQGQPITKWIESAFDPMKRLDGTAVEKKIIEPRVEEMKVKRHREDWKWNDFQKACADPGKVPARALLLAPCGSGKTLAAWRWIAARCAEERRGRVIFLYPTRGTATEGYRDYVSYAGPEEAALVHGTADFDLDDILSDLNEEDRIKEARLFALRQWPKQLFSATVDQFLGFLQYGYGPICHLPLLADSVVVFDEIHSYDRGMFSALEQFLEHFEVPVLCMTATLLERRQERLKRGGKLLDRGLEIVKGLEVGRDDRRLQTIADYGRYQVSIVTDEAMAEARVLEALRHKQRVLWVVNTVDRAQEIARRLAADPATKRLRTKEGDAPLFCYHSRFKLVDRQEWHKSVVGAFGWSGDEEKQSVLAVTTQVCEMSLDLDADVLVTEFAPASSLVQRMGRCCRSTNADRCEPPRVGQVILYRPEDEAPYIKKDMLGVEDFICKLETEGTVSQSKLEELLTGVPQAAELPKECRFIHSGPWAAMGEENFRDIDAYNRQALLPSDIDEYVELCESCPRWRADRLILPVPKQFIDWEPHDKLPAWLRITKGGRYREVLGYCEERPDPMIV